MMLGIYQIPFRFFTLYALIRIKLDCENPNAKTILQKVKPKPIECKKMV